MPNKQCSTCKFFATSDIVADGYGWCAASMPCFYEADKIGVHCSDGSDCNAYQSKEEVDVLERVKERCKTTIRNVGTGNTHYLNGKSVLAQQLLQLIKQK